MKSLTVEEAVERIRADHPDATVWVQQCWIVRGYQEPVGWVDARLVEGDTTKMPRSVRD